MAGFICALLISLVAMAAGVFCLFYPLYHKRVCTQPATAEVVDLQIEWREDKRHIYPVFQYKADGQTVRIQHNVSPTPYEIGEQVELLYNPADPAQYYIPHTSGGNWAFVLAGAFFFCMGAFFTVQVVQAWLLPLLSGK